MPGFSLPWFIENPNPNIYLTGSWLALDFETTNKDKGDATNAHNHIVYGYWKTSSGEYGEVREESGWDKLFEAMDRCDFIICQHGKFELKWLRRRGYAINKLLLYDTLLAEYVIAGNRSWSLDLDSISKRYGGHGKRNLVSLLISSGVCPSETPFGILKEYCAQDVDETIRVFRAQVEVLRSEGLLRVFYLRCLTTPVLADIEMNGMFLDYNLVKETHNEIVGEHAEIKLKLDDLTGGINMASATQVAKFLYQEMGFEELKERGKVIRNKPSKQFPQGQPLTDSETILKLRCSNDKQREFVQLKLEESKLRKKITGYTTRFMDACENNGCMLYGTLNQSVSQTHRLTSSSPNLQNIDRKLKRAIKSRYNKWKIFSADYAQLEFRVAGMLSKDQQIYQDIVTKFDVHSYTASILTPEAWIKAGGTRDTPQGDHLRTEAKPETFKPLYGGQKGSKPQQRYYQAFREKYNTTYQMQKGWTLEVLKTKKLRTPTGLIFYWPDTTITGDYITNTPSIFNYPIQMFATADIAPAGVIILWHTMKAMGLQSFLINTVHDSVLGEVHPDEVDVMRNLVPKAMSKDIVPFFDKLFSYSIDYPMEVDVRFCTNWDYNIEEKSAA
jgi:DNA polymerase I-like protein with 3'-5' exonuclease and polymerase domains